MKCFERATEYNKYWNGTRAIVYNYNMNTVREWEANGWKLEALITDPVVLEARRGLSWRLR